jgi:hypothetical protein
MYAKPRFVSIHLTGMLSVKSLAAKINDQGSNVYIFYFNHQLAYKTSLADWTKES